MTAISVDVTDAMRAYCHAGGQNPVRYPFAVGDVHTIATPE